MLHKFIKYCIYLIFSADIFSAQLEPKRETSQSGIVGVFCMPYRIW